MKTTLTTIFALFLPLTVQAKNLPIPELHGIVTSNNDGDTMVIQYGANCSLINKRGCTKRQKVRLAWVDAPEYRVGNSSKTQPFGQASKQKLWELVEGKLVVVKKVGVSWGRVVGHVYVDGRSIAEDMLRGGFAWVEPRYNKSIKYRRAEEQAKAATVGLWSQEKPLAPWLFRKKYN